MNMKHAHLRYLSHMYVSVGGALKSRWVVLAPRFEAAAGSLLSSEDPWDPACSLSTANQGLSTLSHIKGL